MDHIFVALTTNANAPLSIIANLVQQFARLIGNWRKPGLWNLVFDVMI